MKTVTPLLLLLFVSVSYAQFDVLNDDKKNYAANSVASFHEFILSGDSTITTAICNFNKNGTINETIYFSDIGDFDAKTVFQYISNSKIITTVTYPDNSTYTTEFFYDSQGNIIKSISDKNVTKYTKLSTGNIYHQYTTYKSGDIFELFYKLDDNFKLISTYNSDDETQYFYNEKNLLTSVKYLEFNQLYKEELYEYFDNNLLKKITINLYENNSISYSDSVFYKYTFY